MGYNILFSDKMRDNQMAVVCVHGDAANGLNIVRSLGKAKIPVTVVGISGDLNLARHSRYCYKAISIKNFNKTELIEALNNIQQGVDYKPVLFFDNDYLLALLNDEKEYLSKHFLLAQEINDYVSKEFQMNAAKKAGLHLPQTWHISDWSQAAKINPGSGKRLIAKPKQGAEKKPFKIMLADNTNELITKLKNTGLPPCETIIQEYIPGDQQNVWAVLGYRSRNFEFSPMCTAIKYAQAPPEGGVMAIGKTIANKRLEEESKALIEAMHYYGIFGVEFKYNKDEDKYYFIEMSPRTEGFHSITQLIGLDLPEIAFFDLAYQNKSFTENLKYKTAYWINSDVFLMSAVKQRSIKELFKIFVTVPFKKRFMHFMANDLCPFWHKKIRILCLTASSFFKKKSTPKHTYGKITI